MTDHTCSPTITRGKPHLLQKGLRWRCSRCGKLWVVTKPKTHHPEYCGCGWAAFDEKVGIKG